MTLGLRIYFIYVYADWGSENFRDIFCESGFFRAAGKNVCFRFCVFFCAEVAIR